MVAISDRAVEQEITGSTAAGGVVMPTSQNFPRTDENCLPTRIRVPVDTNADGLTDHVATVAVKLVDLDGNGRWDRYIDGVLIDPCGLERIDPAVAMAFSPSDWRNTVKRAAAGL